jgi:hypothetical protein
MRANVGEIVAIPGGAEFSRSILHDAAATAAGGHAMPPAALTAADHTLATQGSSTTSDYRVTC